MKIKVITKFNSYDSHMNEKFWEKVDKKGDNECWNWKGTITGGGYGYFYRIMAHRFSYMIKNGKIPKGKEICHKCNNPKCVNPNHLYAGTHAENMKDMSYR